MPQLFRFDRILDKDERLIDGQRFFQKIVSPKLGCPNRSLNGSVAGDHNYFRRVIQFSNSFECLQSVHAGQPDIEQHYFETIFTTQQFNALFAAFRGGSFVALVCQHSLQRFANAGFIVNDQNFMHAGQFSR